MLKNLTHTNRETTLPTLEGLRLNAHTHTTRQKANSGSWAIKKMEAPTDMTWTTTQPTKPGWYWYRWIEEDTTVHWPPCVVHVTRRRWQATCTLVVAGADMYKCLVRHTHGEWSSAPSEPPEEGTS